VGMRAELGKLGAGSYLVHVDLPIPACSEFSEF